MLRAKNLPHDEAASAEVVGPLDHQAVVAVEVWLAFGAVEDYCVDGLVGGREDFDSRWKSSAAHADDSCGADAIDEVVVREAFPVRVGHESRVARLVCGVGFNHYRGGRTSVG